MVREALEKRLNTMRKAYESHYKRFTTKVVSVFVELSPESWKQA